jgi:hypothetical protein
MDKAFKQATFLVTKLEKLLQKNCRRIPPDSVQGARQTIAELRESIRSKDDPGVRQGYEELRRFQEKHFPGAHKPMTRIILEVVSLALVVSLLLHTFVVAAFTIPTPSMDPTLAPGDVILVWRSAYAVNIPFSSRRLFNVRKPKRWRRNRDQKW